jgi:hypothetical protein
MQISIDFNSLPNNVSSTVVTGSGVKLLPLEADFKEGLQVLERSYFSLTAEDISKIYEIVKKVR